MKGDSSVRRDLSAESIDTLKVLAINSLEEGAENIRIWALQVKDDEFSGRFRTAKRTRMEANVISTCRVLEGIRNAGVYEDVISREDERSGIEWILDMKTDREEYLDPVVIAAKPEDWDVNAPWPPPALREVMSRYAQSALRSYGYASTALPQTEPPAGWPNVENADATLDWIKVLPWDTSPYTAGSLSRHMAFWVLEWYKKGKVSEKLFVDILKYFYSIQNPETGLFGNPNVDKQNLINGAFKLFTLIRGRLDLSLPHAKKIIDQVIDRFGEKQYDETASGCGEWDNWYVLALSLDALEDKEYRREEILRLAALRVVRIFELFGKPDGGLGMYPKNFPEAIAPIMNITPEGVEQGISSGLSVLSSGINVCVDILGIAGETKWTGEWKLSHRDGNKEDKSFCDKIEKAVFE